MKAILNVPRCLQTVNARMPWLSIEKQWPIKLKVATRVRIAVGQYRQRAELRLKPCFVLNARELTKGCDSNEFKRCELGCNAPWF